MKQTVIMGIILLVPAIYAQHAIEEKATQVAQQQRTKESAAHTMLEHTKAVESCEKKLREIQHERYLSSTNGIITEVQMVKPRKKTPVRKAHDGTRQPYAQKGSTYKLAQN